LLLMGAIYLQPVDDAMAMTGVWELGRFNGARRAI
jgi:hypothetical protein